MNDYLNQVLSPKKCSQTTKDYIRQIELLPSFGTAIILHQENQYFSQSGNIIYLKILGFDFFSEEISSIELCFK